MAFRGTLIRVIASVVICRWTGWVICTNHRRPPAMALLRMHTWAWNAVYDQPFSPTSSLGVSLVSWNHMVYIFSIGRGGFNWPGVRCLTKLLPSPTCISANPYSPIFIFLPSGNAPRHWSGVGGGGGGGFDCTYPIVAPLSICDRPTDYAICDPPLFGDATDRP